MTLQAWSCAFAFLASMLPAFLVARLLRSWILFVSMLSGTLWGLWPYLSLPSVKYVEPVDEVRIHTVFVLRGTISGALFGLGVGLGILLIRSRLAASRSKSAEGPG